MFHLAFFDMRVAPVPGDGIAELHEAGVPAGPRISKNLFFA
jgi:hypothetical protein